MNTGLLYELLWKDEKASSYVLAVIPPEALRFIRHERRTQCYIVNTRKSEMKNSPRAPGHWIVLVLHGWGSSVKNAGWIEVFDSLAMASYQDHWNEELKTFISKHNFSKNLSAFQPMGSEGCAYYCLFYVYYKSRKYSSKLIYKILSNVKNIKLETKLLYKALHYE